MARRKLRGSRMVITGASSGIGRALAIQAAKRGARLLLVARRRDRLDELARRLRDASHNPADCEIIDGDLADASHRDAIGKHCRDQWNGLDVLVNNAGLGAIGRFDAAAPESLRRVMEVNFFAPVELTRMLLPLFAAPDREPRCAPAVVIVGSVLSLAAVPLKSEYCASKFAIHGWAESLRSELSAQQIDVLEMHPSTTKSEFFEHALGDPRLQKSVGAMTPEGAAASILRGIERGRKELVFPWSGRALVALRRWAPPLFRFIMKRSLDS